MNPDDQKINMERFGVFVEGIAEGVYETNLRGDFTFFNRALCRLFGCSPEEMLHRNFREFMDEYRAQQAFERFNEVYRAGKEITDLVWQITRQGGDIRIIELSARLILDGQGERTGFRGIARDITERHYAQKALKESEQRYLSQYEASRRAEVRYRTLLDFVPDPLMVFHLDGTVAYVNPAFVNVFGWSLEELVGRRIPFVPPDLKEQTRAGLGRLKQEKVIHGFETKRLTKSGRLLDIRLGAAMFYEETDRPAGQVVILRDVTAEKRATRINQALLRVSMAPHKSRPLNEFLEVIIKEIQELIDVEGASVILLDEANREFYFPVAVYEDTDAGRKMREIRFPADKGVAAEVVRRGEGLIVPDTSKSPYFYQQVDEQSQYRTRNMLDVPIVTKDRIIGVLCAVNKKGGDFDRTDVDTLSAVAGTVALPIENARVNQELKCSYQEVQSLNQAKDRIIHHLSHELKTPVSVLSGSLSILGRKLAGMDVHDMDRTLERAQRNLERILDIEYGIEDILRDRKYQVYRMMSALLDVCADELEVLAVEELGEGEVVDRIRHRIRELFGPTESPVEKISLTRFVRERVEAARARMSQRRLSLMTFLENDSWVRMPRDVLRKVIDGLIRNAVENTPDGGRIEVNVRKDAEGSILEVHDYGVGITDENQRRLFESVFTTHETAHYSSKRPYDFRAGGKGFDLLRTKIFSERYHFQIRLDSNRCRFIPRDADLCPGNIDLCAHCGDAGDCFSSGGTTVTIEFPG
ncbi:MAG: PAS domain S-box protein [Deltaproteobacteria bacterium]|nr:PAS domain S-box protein [Deltaproteobacteria bacterium]